MTFAHTPYIDPNAANRQIAEEGITDLRFLPAGFFRSRRTDGNAEPIIDADLNASETAPIEGPTPTEGLRARLGAILRSPQARGKADAALALALGTDMTTEQIAATLRDLPAEVDLGLPPKAITDPDAKIEADRICQIVTADAAAGHHDQAVALALDTDTPVATALTILGAMPEPVSREAAEARFAEGNWFGEHPTEMEAVHGDQTAAGWSSAVAKANARIGAASPEAPASPENMTHEVGHD